MEKRTRSQQRTLPGTHMVNFRANTENIKYFMPKDLSSFVYTLACSYCGHVLKGVKINPCQYSLDGSSAKVNYSAPCPECKKDITFTYIEDYTLKTYYDYSVWRNLFLVDCNGCRIDVINCTGWKVVSASGAEYEWDAKDNFFDYDEILEKPIGISDVDYNVVTLIE